MKAADGDTAEYCPCVKRCTDCPKGFEKVVDLKRAGLVIYRRTITTENVDHAALRATSTDESKAIASDSTITKDIFILHNTRDTLITSRDFLPEMEKREIICTRCRLIMEHALKLLQKVPAINRHDILGICDHCKLKEKPCHECEETIKEFFDAKKETKEFLYTKNRVREWLPKASNVLKDFLLGEKENIKERKRAHSDLRINQLCRRDYAKSNRELDIKELCRESINFPSESLTQTPRVPYYADHLNRIVRDDSQLEAVDPSRILLDPSGQQRITIRKEEITFSRDEGQIHPSSSDYSIMQKKDRYLQDDIIFEKSYLSLPDLQRRKYYDDNFLPPDYSKKYSHDIEKVTHGPEKMTHGTEKVTHDIAKVAYDTEKVTQDTKKVTHDTKKLTEGIEKVTHFSERVAQGTRKEKSYDQKAIDDQYLQGRKKKLGQSAELDEDKVIRPTLKLDKSRDTLKKIHVKESQSQTIENDFRFFFPRKKVVQEVKQKQKSSSELIKETQDMILAKSEEAKRLIEEKRLKKAEKEERKKLLREEQARLAAEKKRLAEEKERKLKEESKSKETKEKSEKKDKEPKKEMISPTASDLKTEKSQPKKEKSEKKDKEPKKEMISPTASDLKTEESQPKSELKRLKKPKLEPKMSKSETKKVSNAEESNEPNTEAKEHESESKGLKVEQKKPQHKAEGSKSELREPKSEPKDTKSEAKKHEEPKEPKLKPPEYPKTKDSKLDKEAAAEAAKKAAEREKRLKELEEMLAKEKEKEKPHPEKKHRSSRGRKKRDQTLKDAAHGSDSDLDLDYENREKRTDPNEIHELIKGQKIIKYKLPLSEKVEDQGATPVLFRSNYNDIIVPEIVEAEKQSPRKTDVNKLPAQIGRLRKPLADQQSAKGVICYALSDRTFIEKGWTMLPTEKVVRKINVYRMRPAHPEFDWFSHNKNKRLMTYDTGEKLAEFDDNGRGRWYYKNERMALEYYDAEELNAQQRYVVYSNGEPDERGRSRPYTILATFDYLGNGIVFDHSGKIRLKYNQTEGIVLDRSLGPVSHWKWHSLNDPPVLQQVMIDTQMSHKDPQILKMGPPYDTKARTDNEDMLAIEFDNFIKEKSKKLTQSFKPFQIKMKALKINENFSLKVLDQASIYLIYREGTTNLKLNIGMILDHKEIVDTDTAEVGEVSSNVERLPARTDSIAWLQKNVDHARSFERARMERERRLRPPQPCISSDKITAAASRPMRPPLLTVHSCSATTAIENCYCKSRKPSTINVYHENRLF